MIIVKLMLSQSNCCTGTVGYNNY